MRHRFEAHRLILGLCALTVGVLYALDALGRVDVPGAWLVLLVPVGLCLAGLAAAVTTVVRGRRG